MSKVSGSSKRNLTLMEIAQGFSQQQGIDFGETFCPVARFETILTLIAIYVKFDMKIHHMDVACAFLNGELEEELYMSHPEA